MTNLNGERPDKNPAEFNKRGRSEIDSAVCRGYFEIISLSFPFIFRLRNGRRRVRKAEDGMSL